MKILVCGGRYYNNKERVTEVLDFIHGRESITSLVHGDATGTDTLAKEWALINGIEQKPYHAEWTALGHRAGPIRNALMLQENFDIRWVIAFPGDVGTADMVEKAKRAGYPVEMIDDK
jgi:hypothetical protein